MQQEETTWKIFSSSYREETGKDMTRSALCFVTVVCRTSFITLQLRVKRRRVFWEFCYKTDQRKMCFLSIFGYNLMIFDILPQRSHKFSVPNPFFACCRIKVEFVLLVTVAFFVLSHEGKISRFLSFKTWNMSELCLIPASWWKAELAFMTQLHQKAPKKSPPPPCSHPKIVLSTSWRPRTEIKPATEQEGRGKSNKRHVLC